MVVRKSKMIHKIEMPRWAFSVCCLAIFNLSGLVQAQVVSPAGEGLPPNLRQESCLEALKHLRDGNVELALKGLERVADADAGAAISLADEDFLAPACAGLHRALAQLSSEAQFDLLSKWSLPADSPQAVRVLTALVPTIAPPAEFARALGERPRSTSFPVSSIGEARGVFSTGWSLVVAARDSGRLKRLITDLGPLVEKKVSNAELLMTLARIADGRGDVGKVSEQFSQRVDQLKGAAPQTGAGPKPIDSATIVLASAALQVPSLRPLGEKMFAALLAATEGQPAARVRPFLRQAHATAMLVRDENAGESKLDTRFKYWVPVSRPRNASNSLETTGSNWLAHDDHLLHLSGAGHDVLMLRYPLLGEFEFQCETQIGRRFQTDGELIYGGLGFQVLGTEFHVTGSDGAVLGKRPCPFVRPRFSSSFNRLSISAKAGAMTMSLNLHPQWTDKFGFQASPWIGLGSFDESRPLFRNIKLTGHPLIPRSVRLINDVDGGVLRGWYAQIFGDCTHSNADGKSDWRVAEGVLSTSTVESKAVTQNQEQVLFYQRPLLDGETVSYEFFYKPGECEISPTLGRVVFLLQPEGVRLRWLTDGSGDWTGLAADNTVTEPLNRRGPRPLPLRANEWNRVTMARTKGTITLSLDDTIVYQRPTDWEGDQCFGLNRHGSTIEVKVRNVVLTGDWPEALPNEFLDNPLTTDGKPLDTADRHALNRLFQEEFLAENLLEVRRRSIEMPVAERFEFLSRWILPAPGHRGFRVAGDFTPTRPAPMAFEPGVKHPELGGQIISPVFDWIDAARELGRLADCRQRVEEAPDSDDNLQMRSKVALLLLISLAQTEAVADEAAWEKLFGLLKNETNAEGENHWPEVLVATRDVADSPDSAIRSELIGDLALQRMFRWRQPDIGRWHSHLSSVYSKLQRQREPAAATKSSTELHQWVSAAATKASTAGLGNPNLSWIRRDNRIVKVAGHGVDYLFYQTPISGNFQIECNLVQSNINPIAILIGGSYVGPLGAFDGLDTGSFQAAAAPIMFQPKLTDVSKPMRFRAEIQDGNCTIYLNGRKVLSKPLPPHPDPWIALRCPGWHRGTVEDFRILGQPIVLDNVRLLHSNDLTGWLDYYEEGGWEAVDKSDDGIWIVGHSNPALAETYSERLLRYQRPLVEDGSIEYEFFYEPGVVEVCPALDRLAFLLHPSGVREHWLTDGKFGPVELRPDNVTDVPNNRRGPAELPLKARQWNRLVLSLRGSTVNIQVNGRVVYERELEPLNRRTFGLFHYADATEARVRNVVIRGDWPKRLPRVSEQEVAGKTTESIDADLPRLKSVFTHSFEKEGLPEKYFELPSPNPLIVTREGVRATQNSEKDGIVWEMIPRFALSGDFDIETSYSQIKLEVRTQYCGILFRSIFDDPQRPCYDVHRISNQTQQLSQASVAFTEPSTPGAAQWRSEVTACETDSGRLRLARRGRKLTYLFSEGHSETYHVVGTEDVSQSDTIRHGVRLQTFAVGGKTNVIWKNVTLRAERMMWFPVPSQANVLLLKVAQADGSGIRTIAQPSDMGFKNVGSPEWSRDGRKIAVDMSSGGTQTSHIVVMNADGTERRDLGAGCMPSFSADGKKIAFSHSGIMTMNVDGTDRQVIDPSGWGTQWSPDGKWIAYGKSGNITLLDVATRKTRQLLVGQHERRYGYIYWNIAWSHDSRGLAFKGRNRMGNQDELAFAEIDSPDGFHLLQADAKSTYPDISFSPDSKQVVAAMDNHDGKGYRLHAINIKQPGLPRLLDEIPPNESVDGVAWSHDGKAIAITVLDIAQPTEWVTGMKTN